MRDDDPNFNKVNSVDDLERALPGTKEKILDWMKNYKTAEGKGVNKLASETFTTPSEATNIVSEVNQYYLDLVDGKISVEDKFAMPSSKKN